MIVYSVYRFDEVESLNTDYKYYNPTYSQVSGCIAYDYHRDIATLFRRRDVLRLYNQDK